MRKIIILLTIFVTVVSCGKKKEENSLQDVLASNDLKKIRLYKKELDKKEEKLATALKQLSEKISELDPNKKESLITTIVATEKNFEHFLELQGDVQTKKNVLVYPETPGQIVHVYVREGQRVTKGQPLAQIDAGGLSNQLAQVEVSANLAKTTYERQKRLWKQKIGSEIQYLQAKTNYEAQSNAVSNIRKSLDKYTVKAPFSGIIDDVIKEQGTVVAPGPYSEIFRIVNLGDMYVETNVPESHIASIKKGKRVQVVVPVIGKTIFSKVRQTGSFINPANRTFKVEVAIPNKDRIVKPNMTAKLKINDYTNPKGILIPQSVISENAEGQQYVYVVTDVKDNTGIAKQVIITTGKTQGDVVEVLSGIKSGDHIIKEGARTVQKGQKVRILERN